MSVTSALAKAMAVRAACFTSKKTENDMSSCLGVAIAIAEHADAVLAKNTESDGGVESPKLSQLVARFCVSRSRAM